MGDEGFRSAEVTNAGMAILDPSQTEGGVHGRADDLPVYTILWRGFSVYIAAFTGLVILARTVYRDTRTRVWGRNRLTGIPPRVSRPSGSGSPG